MTRLYLQAIKMSHYQCIIFIEAAHFHRLAREFERPIVGPGGLASSLPSAITRRTHTTMDRTSHSSRTPLDGWVGCSISHRHKYGKDLRVDLMKSYTNILKFVPLNVYIISIHQATHPWIKLLSFVARRED